MDEPFHFVLCNAAGSRRLLALRRLLEALKECNDAKKGDSGSEVEGGYPAKGKSGVHEDDTEEASDDEERSGSRQSVKRESTSRDSKEPKNHHHHHREDGKEHKRDSGLSKGKLEKQKSSKDSKHQHHK